VCLISGFGVAAQTRIPAPSHYEVASIKPNQSGARHAILSYPGGRLVTTYATLKALIGFAYNLRDYQISGGPNWLDSTGYDILASPEHPVNPSAETIDTFHQLMRTLLSDRFQLTTHFEARELRVYALVPAERKGRCPATPINGGTFRKGGADATRFARVPKNQARNSFLLLSYMSCGTLILETNRSCRLWARRTKSGRARWR